MLIKKGIFIALFALLCTFLNTSEILLAEVSLNNLTHYFSLATSNRANSTANNETSQINAMPGQVIMILVENTKHNLKTVSLKITLHTARGDTLVSVPLLLYLENLYYAFLPIPQNTQAGNYQYRVIQDRTEAEQIALYTQDLRVGNRNFQIERVALNNHLAKRRTSPANPRVVQEAKEIWNVTKTVNDGSVFAFEKFILPLKEYKYISGMFADRRTYTYLDDTTINGTSHGGVDIAAPQGTPVYSSASGKVVLAKERVVTGLSVLVEHFPGLYSMYYHLHSIDVQVGDIVSNGEMLGTVGNTGFSTGSHLHWEIRVNNVRVDPILFLERLDKNIIKL